MHATTLAERIKTSRRRQGPKPCAAATADSVERTEDTSAGLLGRIESQQAIQALTIRRVEQRLLELFSQGKITGTVHTCIGQEFVGVAVAEHLLPGDYLFSNHRGHGHYLAWTDDVQGLIAELMGRTTGVCGGRGGSQHLCRDGFFSNGIQGGTVPIAGGLALAQVLDKGQGIAAVFIGDGTLGEGVVYETLNMASAWSLPLLIVVEDNGIAQSTRTIDALAGSIAGRAAAFDVDYVETSTDDPAELIATTGQAIRRVRDVRLPVILHVHTRRLRSHSKGDDTRSAVELAELDSSDPLNEMLADDSPTVHQWLAQIDRRIDEAIAAATTAPQTTNSADPTSMGGPPPMEVGDAMIQCRPIIGCPTSKDMEQPLGSIDPQLDWIPLEFTPARMTDAIRDAFATSMERNDKIVMLGEDIRDPYGGAFKVTAGLSSRWPDRVFNTPISEAGIVGMANGLALAGWRPVVEIMFGDFLMLAADQIINHAAKFAWMYNGQVSVPIIIRTPMGGYRGYGPTHSQSLEKHLLGLPGTRVIALTHRFCPGRLYRTLLHCVDRPTIVIENKLLYGQKTDCTPPPGWRIEVTGYHNSAGQNIADSDTIFPTVRLRPPEPAQLTLVAYGGMVPLAEQAIKQLQAEEDLACELLIPTQLYPLVPEPMIESVARTGRLLVVEEGQGFTGFGSELIAQLACQINGATAARFARVYAAACPIPAARLAEQQVLPNVAAIVAAARQLVLH